MEQSSVEFTEIEKAYTHYMWIVRKILIEIVSDRNLLTTLLWLQEIGKFHWNIFISTESSFDRLFESVHQIKFNDFFLSGIILKIISRKSKFEVLFRNIEVNFVGEN